MKTKKQIAKEYMPPNWDLPIFRHYGKGEEMQTELTKDEAYAIANHIDNTLIEEIRSDVDIDSMQWLRNIIHGYEKLCRMSGYVGLTESGAKE